MFFVFEGLDGSGSTTQAKLLAEHLKSRGVSVLHTSEPTDNLVGGLIRGALTKQWQTSPEGLQLLFCADRAHHLQFEIEPALGANKVVISDRYFWSTIAYGSLSTDEKWLEELNKHFRVPDFTFLLKVDPATCIKRIHNRGNDTELFEQEAKLTKVWQSFERLAEKDMNAMILNGEQSEEDIAAEVIDVLSAKFPQLLS